MKMSVVTPSFNQGRFIEQTLRSVAMQHGVSEHVVFDGASTDGTPEILRGFEHAVRWVSEPDRGQAHAVNRGIRATDGDVIGWLNSDDLYYPDAIPRVLEFLAAHPEVDVVYGMADHLDVDGRVLEPYPTEPWDRARLLETCFVCQPAAFFRRRVVEACGLLDESLQFCMDYEYWLRLGRAGVRFAYLEQKLAGSRLYPENKTLRARAEAFREINDMLRRSLPAVPDRWLFNYAHAVVQNRAGTVRPARAFALLVGVVWLAAALRWNRCLSPALLRRVFGWVVRPSPAWA